MKFVHRTITKKKAPSFGRGGGSAITGGSNIPVAEEEEEDPLLPFGARFVAAGDSITDNGHAGSGTLSNLVPRGYWTWAMVGSNGRIRPVLGADAGVSGNSSTQLLARFDADVIAKAPDLVFILIGTNDISAGTSTATIIANIQEMVTRCRNIGAYVIIGRILPRGSVGSPMTGPQVAAFDTVNAAITAMDNGVSIRVWDAEDIIGTPDANHTMQIDMSTSNDYLHPNTYAAQQIGLGAPLNLVNAMVHSGDSMFTSNTDPLNYIVNGFFTGTAGTNAGGATGTVPTGWAMTAAVAGGAAVASSVIDRGANGQWWQVAVSGNYTGNGMRSQGSRTMSSISIPSSSLVSFEIEIEMDGSVQGVSTVGALCQLNGGTYSIEAFAPYSGEVRGIQGPFSGVIRSIPFTAPATITSLAVFPRITFLDSAGSSPVAATVRYGRAGFRIVT